MAFMSFSHQHCGDCFNTYAIYIQFFSQNNSNIVVTSYTLFPPCSHEWREHEWKHSAHPSDVIHNFYQLQSNCNNFASGALKENYALRALDVCRNNQATEIVGIKWTGRGEDTTRLDNEKE